MWNELRCLHDLLKADSNFSYVYEKERPGEPDFVPRTILSET